MTDSPVALAAVVAEGAVAPEVGGPVGSPIDQWTVRPSTYPALLAALHESVAPGRLVASATGILLASRDALPLAPDGGLARFGAAWTTAGEPTAPSGTRISTAAADRERFARGLLALHGSLLRDVLRHAMRWLDGRTAEGSSLLARQLNQGACADAAVEITECEAMCADLENATPEIRRLISRRLTGAGRGLLDLLGAAGFLSDGPGGDLYLAELADNVYLHPGTENEDACVDHR